MRQPRVANRVRRSHSQGATRLRPRRRADVSGSAITNEPPGRPLRSAISTRRGQQARVRQPNGSRCHVREGDFRLHRAASRGGGYGARCACSPATAAGAPHPSQHITDRPADAVEACQIRHGEGPFATTAGRQAVNDKAEAGKLRQRAGKYGGPLSAGRGVGGHEANIEGTHG